MMSRSWNRWYAAVALAAIVAYHNTSRSVVTSSMITLASELACLSRIANRRADRERVAAFCEEGNVALKRGGGSVGNRGDGEKAGREKKGRHNACHCCVLQLGNIRLQLD